MAQISNSQAGAPELLYVECGRLIDGTGAPPKERVSLVIEGGVVREVVPTAQLKASGAAVARTVDASGATVLPGLMDLHVHLASIVDPDEPQVLLAMMGTSSQLTTLHAAKNARLMLEGGFTTLRDVAGYTNFRNSEVIALRRATEIGLVPGPRIFAAGWVSQTAGHLDQGPPLTWPRPAEDRADGPWAARRQVREMVRSGVDLIKTSASGGGGGHGEQVWWRNYTSEELEAIGDEAHAYGRRVAVHVHTAEALKRAVRAGLDTMEHGTELDDEAIGLMADRGTYLVPTLFVRSRRGLEGRIRGGAHPGIVKKHEALMAAGFATVGKAFRAGVKIACGTDTYRSLRYFWGDSAYELECLVEAGLSPMEAIVAATRVSAEALGEENRLGTLQPGRLADLIVLEGDPLADIRLLQQKERIRLVLKGGQIVVDRRGPEERLPGTLPWKLGG